MLPARGARTANTMDVGLATTTIWRRSRLAAMVLRRLLCPCVRVRPFLGVPVKQVTEEIVDYVGQWEKIVDAPVPLRSLDAELGDRFLQVLEQIVEVLKVLPEQTVNSRGFGYLPVPQVMESVEMQLECVADQIVADPVPEIMKDDVDGVQHVPQEHVQDRVVEHIAAVPVPQIMGTSWKSFIIPCHRSRKKLWKMSVVPCHRSWRRLLKSLQERVSDLVLAQVTPPKEVSDEPVSAGHVEQAVSWFDRKFSPDEPLYRKTGSSGRSSRSKLKSQRSRTWFQSPRRPIWIPGVEPDPSLIG